MSGSAAPSLLPVILAAADQPADASLEIDGVDVHSAVAIPSAEFDADASRLQPIVRSSEAEWILLLRPAERLSDALRDEIARRLRAPARAWGYRLRVLPSLGGEVVQLGSASRAEGELRLLSRRHLRFGGGTLQVQGTVLRLDAPLVSEVAVRSGNGESLFIRSIRFLSSWVREGAPFDRTTCRYLWLRSGRETPASGGLPR